MSGGGAGASSSNSRVSIPKNVKTMIQSIKEMTAGNHSDEEIHAMLKECAMDPNETAQKLLALDPFHEVKTKRAKRKELKENLRNYDPSDSKIRAGIQVRSGRGGRGSFPSRYTNDAGDGRTASSGKENGVKKGQERGVVLSSLPGTQKIESKALASVSSSLGGASNGPTNVSHGSATEGIVGSGVDPPTTKTITGSDELVSSKVPPPSVAIAKIPTEVNHRHKNLTLSSDQTVPSVSGHGVYSSSADPVLVLSIDSRLPSTVGTIKREVGSQRSVTESNTSILGESRSTATVGTIIHNQPGKIISTGVTVSESSSSLTEKTTKEAGNSYTSAKVQGKSQTFERNQSSESSHPLSLSTHGISNSRPSSNYGSKSQQIIGSQKAGPSKEWKPKTTNPNTSNPVIIGTCEVASTTVEVGTHPLPTLNASNPEESASKLPEKFDVMHLSHNQHVIIPNHLQVPESERSGLSFGSFSADFGVKRSCNIDRDTDKTSAPISDSSQEIEEIAEEPSSSNQIESPTTAEGEFSDHPESPKAAQDNLSPVEADTSTAVHEYVETHQETVAPLGVSQYSVVHTAPSYNVGVMPPILGTHFAPFDTSESQARDASRPPSFIVQQSFDPSGSYLPQFYRPSGDGDGRMSPFPAPGSTNKYNGNLAVLSQSSNSQETGSSLVLSTAGPTPHATQAAGVLQNSLAVTQQPVPIFRPPSGVHMPHYPPNFIPYNQYFPPFYLPPQSIHHYLPNPAGFPQQPPTGNVYPPPTATAATGVKYSLSQYKPVTNAGNSAHTGLPSGYAPYSSSPTGYSPTPAASVANTTGNEDPSASHYRENSVYVTGQQSEGSGVWIPALGRNTPGLQPGSFYNPQGQHVTFAPTQASHGAFTGIYHPTQTMPQTTVHPLLHPSQSMSGAVEMVGPSAGVYQQNQRGQMNWTNNY